MIVGAAAVKRKKRKIRQSDNFPPISGFGDVDVSGRANIFQVKGFFWLTVWLRKQVLNQECFLSSF